MIFVTGGAGYIGSHTVLEILKENKDVVVLDDFSNSSRESLVRVASLTGKEIKVIAGDVNDRTTLREIFKLYPITSVFHFSGFKSVSESGQFPLRYYWNNVAATVSLCEVMAEFGIYKLIFSSSATIYGNPDIIPVTEESPIGDTVNPYGTSKYMVERILEDVAKSDPRWGIAVLRYFNPVGAHESGMIGEDPQGIPNNLVPFIAQVAVGRLPQLQIFGGDYPSHDGIGVRDYIHVVDLALGHVKALSKIMNAAGYHVYNLGTGQGQSVLDVVRAFEAASGRPIPYQIVERRPGDVAKCYANPKRAERELVWKAERDLAKMMEDTWRWQSLNPNGYRDECELVSV